MLLLRKLPLTSPPPPFFFHGFRFMKSRRRCSLICAVEKESEYELDQHKAREALEKLDQQLQSLSKREVTQPRKKVSSPEMISEIKRASQNMREDMPELSDSDFAYSAVALLALTILYNVFFITIIKPSVDGP